MSSGPAITLRELTADDAPSVLALLLENRTFLRPWEPIRPEPFFTPQGQRSALRRCEDDRRADRAYDFAIIDRATGGMIGRITLSNVVRGASQSASVGYFVSEAHGRRGHATEAVRQLLAFAFGPADLHRVQAAVLPRNEGSIRVLQKNGLRDEGLARRYLEIDGAWQDHRIFAITREEWPAALGERRYPGYTAFDAE
ncbi:MAG: GNAT family N-acetyltransferase [Actinobacteria bacterium]|nr:GNAT family N-acetyltransferase [Actinomycetota bacterium]